MVKGSGSSKRCARALFFLGCGVRITGKEGRMDKRNGKDVIAYRKKCQADGTGLSHYILMDKKGR